MNPEQIARICHEANRAYQIELDEVPSPPWRDAPNWQRVSAVEGVTAALEGRTPEESHQGWMRHKINDGWTYGEVKDGTAKTHPCLVEYDELPEEQKVKDHLFLSIVSVWRD